MTHERRFKSGFEQATTDEPGLVMDEAGVAYVVEPGGARTEILGGGVGAAPTFARVSHAAGIPVWNGNRLPFDTIDHDPSGLWLPADFRFAAQEAGWYELALYATNAGGAKRDATSGTGEPQLYISVNGPGNNIYSAVGYHTEVASGVYYYPPMIGHTHLEDGDTVDVQGSNASLYIIPAGFAFSIRLVSAELAPARPRSAMLAAVGFSTGGVSAS